MEKLIYKKHMKSVKLILGIALLSVIVWSCKNETEPETKTVEVEETKVVKEINPNANIAKAEFTIEGMTCAIGCAKTIEKKLSNMEGVKSAKVDFDKKLAMVEYDEAKVTTTSLEETVKKVGDAYSVKEMKTVESFTANFAKKECTKGKAACKKGDKAKCNQKGDKASMGANEGKNKDCKKACCAEKA